MQNNKFMLVIAVAAGIMATVLAFTYIKSAENALEAEEAEETVGVLFVANDLPANHTIDSDTDLREGQVGLRSAPDLARRAVKATERDSVDGLQIGVPLPAGVPLFHSNLTQIQDIDLAPGTRAMAIDVDSANLMGGILVPGDRVDIIASYRAPMAPTDMPDFDMQNPEAALGALMGQVMSQTSSAPTEWQTDEVLSNVRVIAVGEFLTGSRQAQVFGLAGGGGGGSTVTLEVTPEQARALIRASAGGSNHLTLLLRDSGAVEAGEGSLREE